MAGTLSVNHRSSLVTASEPAPHRPRAARGSRSAHSNVRQRTYPVLSNYSLKDQNIIQEAQDIYWCTTFLANLYFYRKKSTRASLPYHEAAKLALSEAGAIHNKGKIPNPVPSLPPIF